jgi:hypothetical protein
LRLAGLHIHRVIDDLDPVAGFDATLLRIVGMDDDEVVGPALVEVRLAAIVET